MISLIRLLLQSDDDSYDDSKRVAKKIINNMKTEFHALNLNPLLFL